MKVSFDILDWQAAAPGLSSPEQWQAWSHGSEHIYPNAPIPPCRHLPMMTARRLSQGSRMAVDCGMALLKRHQPQAVIFTSRHGELERNQRILEALARDEPLSPTDFTMSVHNAAVGSLTIAAKAPLVASSLSAGQDSFQQGLIEAAGLLNSGYTQVLLVDFDSHIPVLYRPHLPEQTPDYPYAAGLILAAGDSATCTSRPAEETSIRQLPQSLAFIRGWLGHQRHFTLCGERQCWEWSC